MAIVIREYEVLRHATGVLRLWERTLGGHYPVSERAFMARAGASTALEPGDGLVAFDGRRLVGFGLVEANRNSLGVGAGGNLAALLVEPAYQRQGLGTRLLQDLEARLCAAGCTTVAPGGGPNRFWTGVPDDLPAARQFFAKHGYAFTYRTPDMTISLGNYAANPTYLAEMDAAGARVVNCTMALAGPLLSFHEREFPGWAPNMLNLLAAGDVDNILMVMHGDEVIGSISAFTPASRCRGANQVWEGIFGPYLGGYGAVGIAKAWRGKGLGAAMSEAAGVHVQKHGADELVIDWVGPVAFYEKLGAKVWRWFDQMKKPLVPAAAGPV